MVLLTLTSASKAAVERYRIVRAGKKDDSNKTLDKLRDLEIGSPIQHEDLVQISTYLRHNDREIDSNSSVWRLDTLLRGASVYRPPPQQKAEPVSQRIRRAGGCDADVLPDS